MTLFVSLIVWCALLLYHLIDDFKAIDVINKNIVIFIEDKFVEFVLLAWLFTGLLQGMAGFGIPAVIVAPILIALGFDPVKSLGAALLGHSWAVTFGSMGAAFYLIQMITGIPYEDLNMPMWIFNTISVVLTGFGVCWLHDGMKSVRKGLTYILPVSAIMVVVQFFSIHFGMYSLASINPALIGLVSMFALYKLRSRSKSKPKSGFFRTELNLGQALLPYASILILSILFQFFPSGLRDISLHFTFPAFETARGFIVPAETYYARMRLFGHPAPILLAASAIALIVYKKAGIYNGKSFRLSLKKTVKKGIPATLALLFLGCMSLIMQDSGMTAYLANRTADVTGRFFPIASPFFGVLGSFLTGNNSNANVLFGSFQYAIAQQLGVSGAVMSAVQTMSAAVGVSIGLTHVLMGTAATNLFGEELSIFKKITGLVLLIALVMGIVNFILLQVVGFGA
jgi:lactate permease